MIQDKKSKNRTTSSKDLYNVILCMALGTVNLEDLLKKGPKLIF